MITIEEKLKVFTKLVVGKAQQEFEQKLLEINQKNHEIIEQHKTSVNQTSKNIIEDLTKKGQVQKNRTISKAKLEKKRKILHKKQQLIDRLVENIRNRATKFTEEEVYEDFFGEWVSRAISIFQGQDGIQLMVTAKDAQRFKAVIYQVGERNGFSKEQIDVSVSRENIIGGIVALNRQGTFRVDCSIIAMLQGHRQLIGQKLYDAFEEAGDIYE